MAKLTKVKAKKYLLIMQKLKRKNITINDIAMSIGIIDSVIRDDLAYFDPIIRLDESYNVATLIAPLEKFINTKSNAKTSVKKSKVRLIYDGVGDFVYKNMTIPGGIINRNASLNEQQLKDLKKIVNDELKQIKNR
ncbi:MAG: hypothetical protein M0P49_05275 [Bacilli bacterium]|jgi:hypothetical protein|nr:hypothetical protein [Bacilli bacterium]MDD4123457.1 hypothetical protein [Bacilli bacterium]